MEAEAEAEAEGGRTTALGEGGAALLRADPAAVGECAPRRALPEDGSAAAMMDDREAKGRAAVAFVTDADAADPAAAASSDRYKEDVETASIFGRREGANAAAAGNVTGGGAAASPGPSSAARGLARAAWVDVCAGRGKGEAGRKKRGRELQQR